MSLMDYLRLAALAGALLIIGTLGYQNLSLKSDLVTAEKTIAERDQTIERANAQNTELNRALVTANREIALQRLQNQAAGAAVAKAAAAMTAMQAAINDGQRRMNDAPSTDDALAAPVLLFASNGLRRFAEALAALRARYDHADRSRGATDPTRAAGDSWPALTWPFTQRQFAAACFELGETLTAAAGNIAGINDYQAEFNNNVRQFNAASAGATP